MKKLPIVIDAAIMTECCTYYKMAVIQTSQHYNEWAASHLEIYGHESLGCAFGYNQRQYDLKEFDNILSFQEIDLWSVLPDKIVERLKEEIDSENYIILDCNFQKLFPEEVDRFYIHETLLFGYDDRQEVFYSSALSNGVFKEITIPFSKMRESYEDIYGYYKSHMEEKIDRQLYFFNITRMRLKENDCHENGIFSFLLKVKREADGVRLVTEKYTQDGVRQDEFYTGIYCLKGFEKGAERLFYQQEVSDDTIHSFVLSLKKLHEHRKIILSSMYWLIEKLDGGEGEVLDAALQYASCCESMRLTYRLAYKYVLTRRREILWKIKERLGKQYIRERAALCGFEERARRLYCDYRAPQKE